VRVSDQVAIVGVGVTDQGKLPGSTALGLGLRSLRLALADAGLEKDRIDGVLTMPGTTSPEQGQHYLRFCEAAGIDPAFTASLQMGGATASALVEIGAMAIASGMARYVACVFGDSAKTGGSRFGTVKGGDDPWSIWGMMSATANTAMTARRHMALYGTEERHLGEVAVTFRRHAGLNPGAVMREPITLRDHAESRLIVDPLHLLDCCLISDGGFCLILGPAEEAADLRRPPVLIGGMGQAHTAQNLGNPDWWYLPHQKAALARAFGMAGIGPTDVDFAQLYDNYTISVLLWLEHAGFCGPGEGGPFVEGGRIGIGGDLPANTGGGNLSASGSQGWLLLAEAVWQLRGEAGERQVQGAEVGLVTGRGMALNTAAALVLHKA
jgi:acetyl-CoA acetyltransferase